MPDHRARFSSCAFLWIVSCSLSLAQIGNFCPIGPCNITKPVYVNVYWESSKQAWDQDVINAGMPDLASGHIDALTMALMHSNYFAGLSGYGVTSASFLRGVALGNCVPLPPELSLSDDMMVNIATCVLAANPDLSPGSAIINVLIPPNVPAGATTAFCATAAGDHNVWGLQFFMTRVPATCNPNISFFFDSLTHEMVEAATDPFPEALSGWKKFAGGSCSEIGDLCVSKCGATASVPPFLFASIQNYFVDGLKACFSPTLLSVPPGTPPSIGVTASGGGSSTIFFLTGTSIAGISEGAPWDLVGGRTLYLQALVSHAGEAPWSVGNIGGVPPDLVGFGPIIWNDNGTKIQITVNGFDSNYGSTVNQSFPIESVADHGITRQGGVSAVVTINPNTLTAGAPIVISGATPPDLNGTFTVEAVESPRLFFYKQSSSLPDEIGGGGTVSSSPTAIIGPGDNITFTYFDPQTGLPAKASATVPFPDAITATPLDTAPGHPTVQEYESFSGVVTAQGSGVQGVTVSCANCAAAAAQTVTGGAYILPYAQAAPIANTQTFTLATTGANQTQVTTSVNVQVFPVVTSVVPAIGPVAGNVSATLNGAGFDPTTANDEVNFNSRFPIFHGGHTKVNPQSVNPNGTSAQLLTPASPLIGDGSGYANVSATVNQLESANLEYLYVVPGKPWLEVMPSLCNGGQATPNVYAADGSPVSAAVTMSASYPAYAKPGGGYTRSLLVTSGQTVSFTGYGPLTATNNQTSQSTTVTLFVPTVNPCTAGNLLWPTIRGTVYLNAGNLIGHIGPNCIVCGEGLTHTGIWTLGNPVTSITNVSIAGSSNREIMGNFQVRAVGAEEFQSYVTSGTVVAVQNSGIAALSHQSTRLPEINFVGPAVAVELRRHWCHRSKQKNEGFRVSFSIPKHATAGGADRFRVLHLVKVNGTPSWVETRATEITGQGGSVTLSTKELGVYALAEF